MNTLAKYHVCNHSVIGEKTFQNTLIGPRKLPGLSRNGPLERVQRKAARFCSQNYDSYGNVTDMIKDLGWATLETRRRQFRLTLMYKINHGLIDIDSREYLIHHPESRTRGSRQFKFRVPYASKDIFKFSFFPRTIADWNCLPEAIVSSLFYILINLYFIHLLILFIYQRLENFTFLFFVSPLSQLSNPVNKITSIFGKRNPTREKTLLHQSVHSEKKVFFCLLVLKHNLLVLSLLILQSWGEKTFFTEIVNM